MIRILCFAAFAFFVSAASCSAGLVIDDFSYTEDAGNILTVSGATLTAEAFGPIGDPPPTVTFDSESCSWQVRNLSVGSSVAFTYTFEGEPLGDLGSCTDLAIPITNGGWNVDINDADGELIGGGVGSSNNPVFEDIDLSFLEEFQISFRGVSGSDGFDFGSKINSLEAISATGVPEPTTLLLFPSAVGLMLARRRRFTRA